MSKASQSPTNFTDELQDRGLVERVIVCTLSTVPCCVFLFINGTMLFTLRSKPVFCETSRYILLFNLLFADTLLLTQSQLLYLLAACRIRLTYPVCGVLTLLANLMTVISPLTLVVMSLERYVAVCYPLRHVTVMTIRNTEKAIIVVWGFSSLNVLIRIILLLDLSFESLEMKNFCSDMAMLFDPVSDIYEKVYTNFLFVSAGLAVTSSYIGVMIAARSASTDKASAQKARNTLLLHLVQLGLSLSSTVHNPLLILISKSVTRIVIVRVQIIFYVCIILLPRCLSALIYGLRPVLIYHLCCRLKLSANPGNAGVSFSFS